MEVEIVEIEKNGNHLKGRSGIGGTRHQTLKTCESF